VGLETAEGVIKFEKSSEQLIIGYHMKLGCVGSLVASSATVVFVNGLPART
jgi:hypothetical protein